MLNNLDWASFQEVKLGVVSEGVLRRRIEKGENVVLRGRAMKIVIGKGCLVKVNTSVGIGSTEDRFAEEAKILALSRLDRRPDIIMDLSIGSEARGLLEFIAAMHLGPVGVLPHYAVAARRKGKLDIEELLRTMDTQVDAGATFFTIHPTPTAELLKSATRDRVLPLTSRGGAIVLKDMLERRVRRSIFADHFQQILDFCLSRNVALSIGTSFRPASLFDALDDTHLAEIRSQQEYVNRSREAGVSVFFEALGHASLDKIARLSRVIRDTQIPMMALGPIPTEGGAGLDHICNAIGASFMAYFGGAHVINSITREEHTGGIPTQQSIIEGFTTAALAAHCVNVALYSQIANTDKPIPHARAYEKSCMVQGRFAKPEGSSNALVCGRCGGLCPLKMSFDSSLVEE